MFVLTFVARLFTFQYDRPHFVPLLRLPPNRARVACRTPSLSSSFGSLIKLCCKFYHEKILLCQFSILFPISWKATVCQSTQRVNPPNLPLRRGNPSEPPHSAATQRQVAYKKGSPRCSCRRPSQGGSHASTTDRTSRQRRGCRQTGQHQPAHC